MSKSDQTPAAPLPVSQKTKTYYEHGKDALELAVSVANMQQERALRKAEKHHQPQSRVGRNDRNRPSDRKKRLEEAKLTITKKRTEAKKEKSRARKESKGRLRKCDDARMIAPEETTRPRKRVSFT